MVIGISGFWIRRRAEGACRKAFLDTRQSIQARLDAHDENDKLERLLLSVLPGKILDLISFLIIMMHSSL